MGYLGWTEQQTLDTSIPAILLAYENRLEMLKLCFGGSDPDGDDTDKATAIGQNVPLPARPKYEPVSPEKVDRVLEMLAG